MNDNIHTPDYRLMPSLLLPCRLRKPRLTALLRALAEPLATLNDRRVQERTEILFSLQHTGQTCHLKNVLNRYFATGNHRPQNPDYQNGFLIRDINAGGDYAMAYDEDLEPYRDMHLSVHDTGQLVLYDEQVINIKTTGFMVYVPEEVYQDDFKMIQVKQLVSQYKLASRNAYYTQKTN